MKCGLKALGVFFMCGAGLSAAVAEVQLLQWERPGRVEHDGSGDFDRLITAILAEVDMPVSVKTMPLMRVRRALLSDSSVCMVPGSLKLFLERVPGVQKENYTASTPIDRVTGHVFSRPGDIPVRSRDQLSGKRLALWVKLPLTEYLASTGVEFVYVASEKEAIQLLLAGRVDLAWGWRPSSLKSYEKISATSANYDLDFSLVSEFSQIMCRKTAETQRFLNQVDVVLDAMRGDGRLKKIFGPHAEVFGVDIPFSAAR